MPKIKHLKKIQNQGGDAALLEELSREDYGDFTLQEIGQVLGITRERVRQIQDNAIKKLKNPSISRSLKSYSETSTIDLSTVNYGRGSETSVKEQ